ncbi:MAG: PEGA domain-containing protein [Deltaproteobacteria bacterium]|nr:PEGA domain-containing protein [Deltaproteobacteria bacterium]
MLRSSWPRLVLALAGLTLTVPSALAQEAVPPSEVGSPEDADSARRAREHFLSGMEHFEAHRYRPAIHDFELAAELVPSADLWFNIARSHEELGEYEPAIEHYRRYLRDRVDPPDKAQVEQRIASLEQQAEAARQAANQRPTTGTLRVTANMEGVDVQLDDRSIGQTPLTTPISLEPGRHRLRLEREGYVPFRSEVRVEAGLVTAAYADMVPATRYRAIRGKRIATWIVGGLAIAGIGTAIGLWGHARGLAADGNYEEARDWGRYSDFAWGGAALLAVTAAILYFVEGRAVGTERVEEPPPAETASRDRATAF